MIRQHSYRGLKRVHRSDPAGTYLHLTAEHPQSATAVPRRSESETAMLPAWRRRPSQRPTPEGWAASSRRRACARAHAAGRRRKRACAQGEGGESAAARARIHRLNSRRLHAPGTDCTRVGVCMHAHASMFA
eukprot:3417375-Pleurochrysis_carterae.AAC.1